MKVLILEDEQLAAEALSNMLQDLVEAEVVGMIPSIEAGRQWFQENERPELILSDIRLQDGISFQLFQELEIKVPIIFVTAYDHYAIKAFEVNSIDYLLKPIDSEQLKGAFDKIKERRLSGGNASQFDNLISLMNEAKKTYRSRFLIKAGQKIKAVGIDKVAYFYSLNKLTYLVTYDGQRLPLDVTLEVLEEQVDPDQFYRANRQFIVGFESISELHPYFKGRIKVVLDPANELELVVSADKTRQFKAWLDK